MKKKEKFNVIKCSRCGIPNPYGSAHICEENDVAELNSRTPLGKRIKNWFMGGMTAN